MSFTPEQKEAIKQVFATYFRNGYEWMEATGDDIDTTVGIMQLSDVGPGPDFFPALELALEAKQIGRTEVPGFSPYPIPLDDPDDDFNIYE